MTADPHDLARTRSPRPEERDVAPSPEGTQDGTDDGAAAAAAAVLAESEERVAEAAGAVSPADVADEHRRSEDIAAG